MGQTLCSPGALECDGKPDCLQVSQQPAAIQTEVTAKNKSTKPHGTAISRERHTPEISIVPIVVDSPVAVATPLPAALAWSAPEPRGATGGVRPVAVFTVWQIFYCLDRRLQPSWAPSPFCQPCRRH
eukprot:1426746-Amphidinium_carterae.1